jgi:hypothetical protein
MHASASFCSTVLAAGRCSRAIQTVPPVFARIRLNCIDFDRLIEQYLSND